MLRLHWISLHFTGRGWETFCYDCSNHPQCNNVIHQNQKS